MKLRILLVDDEPKVLRGIRAIIDRAEEDWEIIGECRNGIEALEAIAKNCPDIVITDIKMPAMDGLELVEKTKGSSPDLKFIILSGYPDFKYAQKALRLETVDYILKPPDYKDILKSIKKVEAHKLEERAKKEEEAELRNIKKAAVQPMRDRLLYELICIPDYLKSNQDNIAYEDRSIFYSDFVLFLLKLDNFPFFIFDVNDEKFRQLTMFREMLQDVVYKRSGCFVDFYDGTYGCFFNIKDKDIDSLKIFAGEVREELQQNQKDSITIGMSRSYACPEKLNKAYKECLLILRNKVFYEKNSIISIEEVKTDISSESYPLEWEQKYIEALKFADYKKAMDVLKEIIDKLILISNRNSIILKSLILEFTAVVERNITESGGSEIADTVRSTDKYNRLNSLDNINDLKVYLADFTSFIIGFFSKKNVSGCRRIINEIKAYININYFINISLRQISNEFFMNESYLSDLFKKETGVSFTSYLTKVRIEKAKELLKQADLKTNDISEMVGYSNSRYFNSVFKKYTGLSPFEYRERV